MALICSTLWKPKISPGSNKPLDLEKDLAYLKYCNERNTGKEIVKDMVWAHRFLTSENEEDKLLR